MPSQAFTTFLNLKPIEMDTIDSNLDNGSELQISPEIRAYLLDMAKWGKFLSIIGFIGIGLMLLMIIIGITSTSSMFTAFGAASAGAFTGMWLVFLIFIVIYFIPTLYLYRGSLALRRALDNQSQEDLSVGFSNYKSLFKFVGILTVIFLAFYAIVIIITLVAGSLFI